MTTDGFLYPNAELERRGLMRRKGFPESYDRRALLRFVSDIKAGKPEVPVPAYSHLVYDVLDEQRVVARPDILVLEGLNVLQPAPQTGERAARWPCRTSSTSPSTWTRTPPTCAGGTSSASSPCARRRSATPRRTSGATPRWTRPRRGRQAATLWDEINGPNLRENIAPTRSRADLVLTKGGDHTVRRIRLRKL